MTVESMDKFCFPNSEGKCELVFSVVSSDYWNVKVVVDDVEVETTVFIYTDGSSLLSLLNRIKSNQVDFSKQYFWETVEKDLKLSFRRHGELGMIKCLVELTGGTIEEWTIKKEIQFSNVQLGAIADSFEAFLTEVNKDTHSPKRHK